MKKNLQKRAVDSIKYRFNNAYSQLIYKEIPYTPQVLKTPDKVVKAKPSAWEGIEQIIADIIDFSKINTNSCLEFGVDFGFSTSVFANYFDKVTGVDIFTGDIHAGIHEDTFEEITKLLSDFDNITLIKADYRDFIKNPIQDHFDLIHVDIIHTYEATFECGLWAAQHSDCTIFHDTESFPEVKKAVSDIAKQTNKKFYNFTKFYGLGIVI